MELIRDFGRHGHLTVGKPEQLSPREQQLIAYLEKDEGRKLTQQEINLALRQAREIGHL